jgi:hypothetical protein
LIWSDENGADAGADSAKKEIEQELSRSPVIFQFSPEHPESQEIEEEVCDSAMEEDIGEDLPDEKFLPYPKWD